VFRKGSKGRKRRAMDLKKGRHDGYDWEDGTERMGKDMLSRERKGRSTGGGNSE